MTQVGGVTNAPPAEAGAAAQPDGAKFEAAAAEANAGQAAGGADGAQAGVQKTANQMASTLLGGMMIRMLNQTMQDGQSES